MGSLSSVVILLFSTHTGASPITRNVSVSVKLYLNGSQLISPLASQIRFIMYHSFHLSNLFSASEVVNRCS